MNQPMPPNFDPTGADQGGYSGRRALLRSILLISIVVLGFVVWQAIQYSRSLSPITPAQPTVIAPPPTGNQTLDQQNERIKQDLAGSQQAMQRLNQSTQDIKRRTKAVYWWLGAAVLLFHIATVGRVLRKVGKAYRDGQDNYAKHYQLKK